MLMIRTRSARKRKLASSSPSPEKSKKKNAQSSSCSSSSSQEPYPDHPNPKPNHCCSLHDDLLELHGIPKQVATAYDQRSDLDAETISFLDGLISTLLSQNTTDANSSRAFQTLKSSFPTWLQSLENAIKCGGLTATKAARIKGILKIVKEKRGEFCLEYLRGLPVDEVKAQLTQFQGIGAQNSACVGECE